MTSVDDERDARQEGDDEYKNISVESDDVLVQGYLERLQETVAHVRGSHEQWNDSIRGQVGDALRQIQQIEAVVGMPLQQWLRQQEAMLRPKTDYVQQWQDMGDPPYLRRLREQFDSQRKLLREHEATVRRAMGLAPNGRWIRVRRLRRPEDVPPLMARRIEREPRRKRGRPRRSDVTRRARLERLEQVVRVYRQQHHGLNPTKPVAAERLHLRSASTIDNWLRDALNTTWKPWLSTLT